MENDARIFASLASKCRSGNGDFDGNLLSLPPFYRAAGGTLVAPGRSIDRAWSAVWYLSLSPCYHWVRRR
jgi:hypothetical protein